MNIKILIPVYNDWKSVFKVLDEINNLDIGFMQGRLSDIKDQKIQQFPYDNWSNEFYLAKKNFFDSSLMLETFD